MDPEVFAQARLRMDQLTKPPRALGYLEEVALRLAALQGRVKPELGRGAVVVAAELVGAQSGLGFMISDAALLFRIPVVFIGIALIGAIGLAMNLSLNALEARIVHWMGR